MTPEAAAAAHPGGIDLRLHPLAPVLVLLSGCAIQDSHIAERAQSQLIGMSEVDLEACLGGPDQHNTFGTTDILTYYATSSSSLSYSIPVVGGIGVSNGAYCHAIFRLDNGHVTRLLYSGEKNATLAPDAYCAPIMRTCLGYLQSHPAAPSPQGVDRGLPARPSFS
ncbi:MAG: hypothetical protein WDN49_18520 [Acetobacteraceae bacterium]